MKALSLWDFIKNAKGIPKDELSLYTHRRYRMSDFPIIKPVAVGVFPNFELSALLYGRKHGEKADLPCIMFVIEVDGKKIVVDTGPCDSEKAAKYHMPLNRDPDMEPANALRNLGIEPEEIEIVILSHLHWDHCSNCKIFKNATFLVQKSELQYAVAPNPIQNSQYEIGFPDLVPPWMEVFSQIETVEGDVHDIVKGVHLITLPGHTPGLMGVGVETKKGVYLIASDCIPLTANWEGDQKLKHIPNGIHINLEDYYRSMKKIEQIADFVLASHDFETLKHKQYPFD
jgi:N-acyl homoserine lactone hydrolase